MRLARILTGGQIWLGSVSASGEIVDLIVQEDKRFDAAVDFIEASLEGREIGKSGKSLSAKSVTFLPPIARPSKNIICVAKNYLEHATEVVGTDCDAEKAGLDKAVPTDPIMFTKAPCTMVGARDDIVVPWELSQQIDYEAELGVIIGKPGRAIPESDAYDHVWGYTVLNDVTARDMQSRHKQWLLGKSLDTFCPIGPWILTADEVDPENLHLGCWVNGEQRQKANTKDLIFDIPTIISTASQSMTLSPGDIIATGTPGGVGAGHKPPVFLKSGDVVKVQIDEIGSIENHVR